MNHSVLSSWQSAVRTLAAVAVLGTAGCSGSVDVPEAEGKTSQEALASCSTQTIAISAAAASSVQEGHFLASYAIDNDPTTRWSSGAGAPQWLRLDLGKRTFIGTVQLDWETAFSPNYEIQVSDDAVNWATVRKISTTVGGHQEISGLDVDARYVRVFCNQVSGYNSVSLYNASVVGAADPACRATASKCGDTVRLPVTTAQASTTEFSYTPASAAVDDVYSTRWSSAWADNQWLALDLGSVASVAQVRLTWQAAYAKSYAIETSTSIAGPWAQAALVTNGVGGVETVAVGKTTRFLRLNAIQRATGYGISLWDFEVLGTKDASCGGDNLLTRGWDPTSVQDVACAATGCGANYTLDAATPNNIGFTGGSFCPVSTANPNSLTFKQAVTAPVAGTKYHLSFAVANYNGFIGSSGCNGWGNTPYTVTLGGVGAANYTPSSTFTGVTTGCVAGNGTLDVDLAVPFAAGETKDLTLGMTPVSFAAGSTGCGSYAESFTITNVKLVQLQ